MEGSPKLSSDSSSPMQDFTYLKLQSGFKGFQKKKEKEKESGWKTAVWCNARGSQQIQENFTIPLLLP